MKVRKLFMVALFALFSAPLYGVGACLDGVRVSFTLDPQTFGSDAYVGIVKLKKDGPELRAVLHVDEEGRQEIFTPRDSLSSKDLAQLNKSITKKPGSSYNVVVHDDLCLNARFKKLQLQQVAQWEGLCLKRPGSSGNAVLNPELDNKFAIIVYKKGHDVCGGNAPKNMPILEGDDALSLHVPRSNTAADLATIATATGDVLTGQRVYQELSYALKAHRQSFVANPDDMYKTMDLLMRPIFMYAFIPELSQSANRLYTYKISMVPEDYFALGSSTQAGQLAVQSHLLFTAPKLIFSLAGERESRVASRVRSAIQIAYSPRAVVEQQVYGLQSVLNSLERQATRELQKNTLEAREFHRIQPDAVTSLKRAFTYQAEAVLEQIRNAMQLTAGHRLHQQLGLAAPQSYAAITEELRTLLDKFPALTAPAQEPVPSAIPAEPAASSLDAPAGTITSASYKAQATQELQDIGAQIKKAGEDLQRSTQESVGSAKAAVQNTVAGAQATVSNLLTGTVDKARQLSDAAQRAFKIKWAK